MSKPPASYRVDERTVVIQKSSRQGYLGTPPFHPDEAYPESPFAPETQSEPNTAYRAVRDALYRSGLDSARFGTPEWNPLGDFIKPGQFVLLKPNMVKETHPRDPNGWVYTITHGSVVRAVADYVWKALEGRGRVVLGDAPQTDSSFDAVAELMGLDRIREFYESRGLKLELVDFRKERWDNVEEVIVARQPLPGDPNGNVAFDLGDDSEFANHGGGGRYYGADYDDSEVNRHHTGGRHEYLLAGSAIKCDVFIDLPKLKTHKKAGVTINLKNLVGINGDKNWLPHHTVGHPGNGGDQFPQMSLRRRVEHTAASSLRKVSLAVPGVGPWLLRRARKGGKRIFGDTDTVIRSGNWWGNDTTWRMCLDLNKILLYGNSDGSIRPPVLESRKPYLCFVDGIVAGQGDGPMNPDPIEAGVLLFGTNPVSTDATAAVLMGFDIEKIPIIHHAFASRGYPLVDADWRQIRCVSNHEAWTGALEQLATSPARIHFAPHFGWAGHIEASP